MIGPSLGSISSANLTAKQRQRAEDAANALRPHLNLEGGIGAVEEVSAQGAAVFVRLHPQQSWFNAERQGAEAKLAELGFGDVELIWDANPATNMENPLAAPPTMNSSTVYTYSIWAWDNR